MPKTSTPKKSKKPKQPTSVERWESRSTAAANVARAWMQLGDLGSFPEVADDEEPEPGGFEVTGAAEAEDGGGVWVQLRMYVSNLDVDSAEAGEHNDLNRWQESRDE